MRIYLKEKQVEPIGDTGARRVWHPGFYQMLGEEREKRGAAWVDEGIALLATEDNQVVGPGTEEDRLQPKSGGPGAEKGWPQPEGEESAPVIASIGLINDDGKEEEDNG